MLVQGQKEGWERRRPPQLYLILRPEPCDIIPGLLDLGQLHSWYRSKEPIGQAGALPSIWGKYLITQIRLPASS